MRRCRLGLFVAVAFLFASTPAFATHIVQLAATSGKVTPLAMPIGEDANLVVTVVDSTGAARDVTGSIFTLTIRHRATDVDAIVARVCTLTTPANGIVTCTIAQSDSNAMTSRMDGFYDVWEEDASGNLTNTVPLSAFSFTPRIRNPSDPLTTPVPPPLQVISGPALTNVEGDVLTEHSDGSVTWAAANGLPSQATHAGEALFTNGTTAAWSPIDFTAGGDLTGTLSAATVAKIQGHAVSATAPTDGQVLQYQAASTSYVPHTLTADDVGAVSSVGAGAGLLATGTTDVTVSMPAVGTAGTYGGGGQCIGSITTDAEGRVSALSTMTPASTLASAYSATTPASNTMNETSGGGPPICEYDGIGTGTTVGFKLLNATAATDAVHLQNSPILEFDASSRDSNVAPYTTNMAWGVVAYDFTTSPMGMVLYENIAGAGWVEVARLRPVNNTSTVSFELRDQGGNGIITDAQRATTYLESAAVTRIAVKGTSIAPVADDAMQNGFPGSRYAGTGAYWRDTAAGAQLTAAATITPTSGQHLVTGATTINTIAVTNFPSASGNYMLHLCALKGGGAVTYGASGNIASAGTIADGTCQTFEYFNSSTTWYPEQ